jgi:hypothetical protein
MKDKKINRSKSRSRSRRIFFKFLTKIEKIVTFQMAPLMVFMVILHTTIIDRKVMRNSWKKINRNL